MTRDDIVSYCTTATGYVEADDLAACQLFVARRDQLIYDAGLWKSSLVMPTNAIAVNPQGNADHAAGQIILPNVFKRIVAARLPGQPGFGQGSQGYSLRVNQLEYYFRLDYDRLIETSIPYEFTILSPLWFNARLTAGDYINVYFPNPNDANCGVRVVWSDSTGQRYVNSLSPATPGAPLALKPPHGDGFLRIERVQINNGGSASSNPPGTDTGSQFGLELHSNSSGSLLASVAAGLTAAPIQQCIQLVPRPQTALQLFVLGKGRYDDLSFATQEPTISNSENLLIALVQVDLLRRGGENGKAEMLISEAMGPQKDGHGGLMQALKDLELVQEATNMRINPEEGYGPEWGLGPYIRPYF